MMFHIIVSEGGKRFTLVMQDENGSRIEMPCRDRQAAYQLGGTIAGAIEAHTRIEVEYL